MHALTVDLEEWYHGLELPRDRWPTTSRLRLGLDPLLALLQTHGIKGTFFVLGVVAERSPEVVTELANEGHEIACHGHAHEFVYKQSPREFRDDVERARGAIGDIVGDAPRGYRAPYFSIRKDSIWALDILADLGFAYDSSIFPVHNYRYGIPDAPREPHRYETVSGAIQELPLTPLRVAGANLPFSGGAYLRILPWLVQRAAWSAATRRSMRVVSYIHPWELDSEQPRIELPRRVAATHYARLRLTHRRLNRLFVRHQFGRLDHAFFVQ
ncbi:MAG: polysaccharide deacetylase family protein [Actinomycetota bacterium]|nr:polysaccharide deacetylase family protein [Actinomycetota bacterium]